MTDEDRIAQLVTEGWGDEGSRLVRLTDQQHIMVSENMMVMLQRQIGFDAHAVMEVNEHITLLDDGTVILESRGHVML